MRFHRRRPWVYARATLACLALASAISCGVTEDARSTPLHVYAASSLIEAFQDLEAPFEASHPGVDLRLTFAGSQVLRLQIEQGAPAHVFASANALHAEALVDGGLASDPVTFATGEIVLIVPLDNPAAIERFEELPNAQRLVLAMAGVPAGSYADELLARAAEAYGETFRAAVQQAIVSREPNVRLVRAKVELGAADAALVYRTDALATERVRVIEVPEAFRQRAPYLVALVGEGRASSAAQSFVTYLRGLEGRLALQERGFEVLP